MRVLLIMVALTLSVAGSVHAQTAPRAYRGLFGPGERDDRRPARLTLSLSLYAGRDDNAPFESAGAADAALQSGRAFQGALASMAFRRPRPRSSLGVELSSALRSYADLNRVTTQRHSGTFRAELQPWRRVTIKTAQTVSYSPTYQLALRAPGIDDEAAASPEAGMDYDVSRERQVAYGSSAGLQYSFGRARQLALDHSASYADFFGQPDFRTSRAGAHYTQRLTPAIELRLGYAIGSMRLSGSDPVRNHDLDLGLNYQRSFTLGRRNTVGFATGSTVISADGVRHVQLTGNAHLRRLLSPRWTTSMTYQRGLQVVDRLPRPFVTDSVIGALNGFLHSRVSVRLAPSYSWGVDIADKAKTYRSWVSNARVDAALSRHWAVYAEHFYYHYRFATAIELPSALATGLDRRGVRWGLALWAPLSR